MSKRARALITLGLLASMAGLAWWEASRAHDATQPLAKALAEYQQEQRKIEVVEEQRALFQSETEALEAELDELRRALPAAMELDAFAAELTAWAAGHGATTGPLRRGATTSRDFYDTLALSTLFTGEAAAWPELLESRGELHRIVHWETEPRGSQLEARLTIFAAPLPRFERPLAPCGEHHLPPAPLLLWPPHRQTVADLRAQLSRACRFVTEHAETSAALRDFETKKTERQHLSTLVAALRRNAPS